MIVYESVFSENLYEGLRTVWDTCEGLLRTWGAFEDLRTLFS